MAQGKIVQRIARLELGLLGDVKPVGEKVWEIRIDYGPGYRLYFTRRRRRIVWLLCGGDKRSQKRDIQRAIAMAARLGIEE
jgi:putative addiction module killer protein